MPTLNGACALPHLGVMLAQGPDAANFLHGQLSQDFALLKPDQARLAAYCSAKGRMLASMVAWQRDAETIVLVMSADLLAATLRRLSMFVLRAKVRLSDATGEFQLLGVVGGAIKVIAKNDLSTLAKQDISSQNLVGLPPAPHIARALWLAPKDVPPPDLPALSQEQWAWAEVRSGVATLPASLADAFVPQMLNYESVGGVNFKKGCYPGQEVVARSQFRGTLKRRAFVVHSAQPLIAGQELFHESDAEQPCGQVVQAAPSPAGGWDAIASMQVSASQSGVVRAQPDAVLEFLLLPYPLLDDI